MGLQVSPPQTVTLGWHDWTMTSLELFSVKLKPGFREPLKHGRFVGRQRELGRLKELFTQRGSATVLIAGFRGAGKTALVDEAIHRAGAHTDQIVVRIAPPHLDRDRNFPTIRSQILRSLSRGLHFECLNADGISKPVLDRIEAAYEKTYLTELQTHQLVETVRSSLFETHESTVVNTKLDVDKSVRLLVGSLAMGVVSASGVGAAALVAQESGLGWGIAALVFVVLTALGGGLAFEKTKVIGADSTEELTKKDSRTEVGKFDLSDETLEFELRRSLEELASEERSVIFVLDELDKLHLDADKDQELEESVVFAILASLKNFFMLGSAIYVFITDDEFFERISLEQRRGGYALSHTIFSDRLYVGPLHYSEVESLIDQSLESPPDEVGYGQFQNFVCWQSKNHAFDALQVLGSFVEIEGDHACLAPKRSGEFEDGWKEGNLPDDWLEKAAFQKHVGVAFDAAHRSGASEALFNQALWESLHAVAESLLDGDEVFVVEGVVVNVPGRFIKSLSHEDRESVKAAVQRMLIRMERHRAAVESAGSYVPELLDEAATPVSIPAQVYQLAADVSYPPSTVASESVLLREEQTLVDAMDWLEVIVARAEGILDLAEEESQVLSNLRRLKSEVERTGPRRTVRRSAVLEAIPQADSLAGSVVQELVATSVEDWADEREYKSCTGLAHASPRTRQTWKQVLSQDFEPLVARLDEMGVEPKIVSGDANENALLVLPMVDDDTAVLLQEAYAACLSEDDSNRDERRQRLPILHVGMGSSEAARFPKQMVDVVSEVQPSGFLARWLGSSVQRRATRTVEADLVGWSHFELDGNLENLQELESRLDGVSFVRNQ